MKEKEFYKSRSTDSDPGVIEARERREAARKRLADFDRETETQMTGFDRRAAAEEMRRELGSLIIESVTVPADVLQEAGMENTRAEIESRIEKLADAEVLMSEDEAELAKQRLRDMFKNARAMLENLRDQKEHRLRRETKPEPAAPETREEPRNSWEPVRMEIKTAWEGFKDFVKKVRINMTERL